MIGINGEVGGRMKEDNEKKVGDTNFIQYSRMVHCPNVWGLMFSIILLY